MSAADDTEWAQLRVLVVNTHVGMLLLTAVRWLLRRERYHVVLLQEVSSPLARARLRVALPWRTWRLTGTRPPSTGRGSSGTIVATRRARLRHLDDANTLMTRYRDRMHPTRRLTLGEFVDRHSEVDLMLASVHPWHIKGGPDEVVAEHDRQVHRYAQAVAEAHAGGLVAIIGGDINEVRERGVARDAFTRVGLRALTWDHIDGLWVTHSPDVRCVAVETIPLDRFRGGEAQHDAISVTLELRIA